MAFTTGQIILYGALGVVGSLIVGFFICALFYLLFDMMSSKKLKKNIPADPAARANPGKQEFSEKEVQEDERRKSTKFREFEKLRRFADNSKHPKRNTAREQSPEGIAAPKGHESISHDFDFGANTVKPKLETDPRTIKKRFRLNRPADL